MYSNKDFKRKRNISGGLGRNQNGIKHKKG